VNWPATIETLMDNLDEVFFKSPNQARPSLLVKIRLEKSIRALPLQKLKKIYQKLAWLEENFRLAFYLPI
jgi:hypothetical protein